MRWTKSRAIRFCRQLRAGKNRAVSFFVAPVDVFVFGPNLRRRPAVGPKTVSAPALIIISAAYVVTFRPFRRHARHEYRFVLHESFLTRLLPPPASPGSACRLHALFRTCSARLPVPAGRNTYGGNISYRRHHFSAINQVFERPGPRHVHTVFTRDVSFGSRLAAYVRRPLFVPDPHPRVRRRDGN